MRRNPEGQRQAPNIFPTDFALRPQATSWRSLAFDLIVVVPVVLVVGTMGLLHDAGQRSLRALARLIGAE